MIIRNSFNVTLSRFKVAGKIVLYDTLVFLAIFAIGVSAVVPRFSQTFDALKQADVIGRLIKYVTEYATDSTSAITKMVDLFNETRAIVSSGLLSVVSIVLGASLFLSRLILNLKIIPMCRELNSFITSNVERGFMNTFIKDLGKSFVYALCYALFSLPFDVLFYLIVRYAISWLIGTFGVFAPTVLVLLLCAFFAVRRVCFFGWIPTLFKGEHGVFRSFIEGVKFTSRRALPLFLICFAINIVSYSVQTVLGFVSFGVSLILTMPFMTMFHHTFELVCFSEEEGRRYYRDFGEVVVPAQKIK